MAFFQEVPANTKISGQARIVRGDSVTIGLAAPLTPNGVEFGVVSDTPAVTCTRLEMMGSSRGWRLSSNGRPAAATISATSIAGGSSDQIFLSFEGHGDGRFADIAVRSETEVVFSGAGNRNHLAPSITSAIQVIDVHSVHPPCPPAARCDPAHQPPLRFIPAGTRNCRIGIFSASNARGKRAVVLLLPDGQTADHVVIGITHGFFINQDFYRRLGWNDPVSPLLMEFAAQKFVLDRWGAQVLAAGNGALLLIVRAAPSGGGELGPFTADGEFTRLAFELMSLITGRSFRLQRVSAFTYSSGIYDFGRFVNATAAGLGYRALYNIDPSEHIAAPILNGVTRIQFTTSGPLSGFEFIPLERWRLEPEYGHRSASYLHNKCMPNYALNLALQLSR